MPYSRADMLEMLHYYRNRTYMHPADAVEEFFALRRAAETEDPK